MVRWGSGTQLKFFWVLSAWQTPSEGFGVFSKADEER
jgi:hypothetical protein